MADDRQEEAPRRAQVEDADYVLSADEPNMPRVHQTDDIRGSTVGLTVIVIVSLLMMGAVLRPVDRRPAQGERRAPNELAAAAVERRALPAGADAGLGVEVETVSAGVAAYYTLKDAPAVPGAQVCAVDEKGAAALAGLEMGDVITALGGKEIDSADTLAAALDKLEPGSAVELTVYRAGETITLSVVIPPPGP